MVAGRGLHIMVELLRRVTLAAELVMETMAVMSLDLGHKPMVAVGEQVGPGQMERLASPVQEAPVGQALSVEIL